MDKKRKELLELLHSFNAWCADGPFRGELFRLDGAIGRLQATIEALGTARMSKEWHEVRELAASLGQTASQVQSHAAILSFVTHAKEKEDKDDDAGTDESGVDGEGKKEKN